MKFIRILVAVIGVLLLLFGGGCILALITVDLSGGNVGMLFQFGLIPLLIGAVGWVLFRWGMGYWE